jgi:tRNA pseudouridine32 synthase/23S rRNA pseudouridine746 synthase
MDAMTLPSRLQLPPGHWPSLLDGLCARFPRIDRAQWQDRFARGRVQDAQGRALAPDMPWQVGLEIQYFREVADEPVIPFAETILHLDAHLLVADKPHFLPVSRPAACARDPAGAAGRPHRQHRSGAAARLDRLTAGLVLFSTRRPRAMPTSGCSASGASKRPMRRWHRRCRAGVPAAAAQPPGAGRAVLPHGRSARRAQCAQPDRADRGRRADLALPAAAGNRAQAPAARAHGHAGRADQGDDLYPQLQARPDAAEPPLQLLAQGLAFDDPLSGEPRRFSSQRRLCLPGQGG